MRLVLDTNILVRSVTGPDGPAAELMRYLELSNDVLVTSTFQLEEFGRVLQYERIHRMHQLNKERTDRHVRDLESAAVVVPLPATFFEGPVRADRDDNPIITTAIVGQADVICTRDKHFSDSAVQSYCTDRGIQIMTDVELLEVLRQAGSPPD